MLQTGQVAAGMVVAGEANSDRRPDPASTIARSGAALLLELSPDAGTGSDAGIDTGTGNDAGAGIGIGVGIDAGAGSDAGSGFGAFAFRTHEEDAELFTAVVSLAEPRGRLLIRRQSRLEAAWLAHAAAAVDDALAQEGLTRDQIDIVVPAQISQGFLAKIPAAIGIPATKVMDFTASLPDTGSTSFVLAWHHLCATRKPARGTRVLFLTFGSGLTVGAATYTT
jgi:hypothetical protein